VDGTGKQRLFEKPADASTLSWTEAEELDLNCLMIIPSSSLMVV